MALNSQSTYTAHIEKEDKTEEFDGAYQAWKGSNSTFSSPVQSNLSTNIESSPQPMQSVHTYPPHASAFCAEQISQISVSVYLNPRSGPRYYSLMRDHFPIRTIMIGDVIQVVNWGGLFFRVIGLAGAGYREAVFKLVGVNELGLEYDRCDENYIMFGLVVDREWVHSSVWRRYWWLWMWNMATCLPQIICM